MSPQESSTKQASKLGFIILLALTATAVYFGMYLYKHLQNTPERMTQNFIQNLQKGEADLAYERLTTDLKSGRQQYWKEYLAQFKAAEGEVPLVSQEFVKDDFSAYPTNSEPQRFVYKFRLQSRDYHLSIVTYKLKGVWVVGALTGAYK